MKKKVFALLAIVGALSLSGCSFFSILTSPTDAEPWDPVKQELTVTQKDLTPHHYYNVDYMPSTGKPKLLVLPIWLADSSSFLNEEEKEKVYVDIEKACFGTTEDTGWHSIASFYKAESYGKCEVEGEVAGWFNYDYS